MTRQVVTVSYTAYVKYMKDAFPNDLLNDFLAIHPVDYKTWAKWMATD